MDHDPQNFPFSQTANDLQTDLNSQTSNIITESNTETQKLPEDKVCTPCLELNLIEKGITDNFKTCGKCGELYCIHAVSKLDPQYCIYCCNDFQMVDSDETVTREIRNEDGKITSKKSFRVRHIGLSGQHWLFYNRAITSLTDLELDCAIEYHRGIRDGMLQEREARRASHAHRNRGKIAGNEDLSLIEGTAANPLIQTQEGAKVTLSTSTVRRTRTIKSGKSEAVDATAVVANAMKLLLEKGFTPEQIAALVKK